MSLNRALGVCQESIVNFSAGITIVDNGNDREKLLDLLAATGMSGCCNLISNDNNAGFGRAHNQVICQTKSAFHLVLNPDVILYSDSLLQAIWYMTSNPDCVALGPEVRGQDGRCQYPCKRYPTVVDLALRGFAPGSVKRYFDARLSGYENRQLVEKRQVAPVSLLSGCFMFCRTKTLKEVGGFDPGYFLYFEDFALSLELAGKGCLTYVPAVRIVHFGGEAGKKGLRHISHFTGSAIRFFSRYGWR